MIKHFFGYNESIEKDLGGEVKRRVLAHNANPMAVKFFLKKVLWDHYIATIMNK